MLSPTDILLSEIEENSKGNEIIIIHTLYNIISLNQSFRETRLKVV